MPVAVVTGANRGLGFEMVRQLLQRGFSVHATYRSSPGLLSAHERLHLHRLDVRDGTAIAEMMEAIGGPVDRLINNAGILIPTAADPAEETANLEAMMDLHLHHPLRLIDTLLPTLQASSQPMILNMDMTCVGLRRSVC